MFDTSLIRSCLRLSAPAAALLMIAAKPATASADTLLTEDFAGGFGDFSDSGRATVVGEEVLLRGALLQSQKGSVTSVTIDASGYKDLELSYRRELSGLDSGEVGQVSLAIDGGPFVAIDTAGNGSSQTVTVPLPASADRSTLQLRFEIDANRFAEVFKVDDIELTGTRTCHFDPADIDRSLIDNYQWAILEDDMVCAGNYQNDTSSRVYSVGKTFSALVFGMAQAETGGVLQLDQTLADWGIHNCGQVDPNATFNEILSMSGHTPGLSQFDYDAIGTQQINCLNRVLVKVFDGHPSGPFDNFVHNVVFDQLGMDDSSWQPGIQYKNMAGTLDTTVLDMAKFGRVINQGGELDGVPVMSSDYHFNMTHPANEAANGGYGYLTWLNVDNWIESNGSTKTSPILSCAPKVLASGDFDASGTPLGGKLDVGVWLARGSQRQIIIGHPSLDLVMVIKDFHPYHPEDFWQAVLPAIVNASGMSEVDFCADYSSNQL